MAMRIQCPNCQAVRAANPRLLGREIRCPECGKAIQVPTAQEVEQARREKRLAIEEERKFRLALARAVAQPHAVEDWQEPAGEDPEHMSAQERALAAASANFTRPRPSSGEDMDMTPMVDVTFLLLIFFMITASFSVQKSIQRPAQRDEEPSTQAVQIPPEDNPDLVTVQVDEFNAYNIITSNWDRVAGSKQDLIISLKQAHDGDTAGQRPTKLLVQAHEDSIHAAVIAALDAGREAQFENFEVSTVEQFD